MDTSDMQPGQNPGQPPIAPRKRLILIVDDLAENLQVLAGHLKEEGYEVLAATSGPRALALLRNRKPDLILLDIMMPGMDGFSVCQEIKGDPETVEIPIIFITARTETDDLLKGFQLGAVDYVTKPFKSAELLARVRTHIELKSAQDLFAAYSRQLERISRHLRRMNEDKNRFLSIVSHDIRGAFGNVISVSRLLTDSPDVDDNEAGKLLADIGIEAEHMIALAENLLNIDAIERREVRLLREPVDTAQLMDFAIQAHQMAARFKGIEFVVESDNAAIAGDLTACRQILTNLVSNAVKFAPPRSKVHLRSLHDDSGHVILSVRDSGQGISAEDQAKLFKPFTRLSSAASMQEHSVGLGLSIVKLMAEGMKGAVTCESSPGHGATFSVRLPATEPGNA